MMGGEGGVVGWSVTLFDEFQDVFKTGGKKCAFCSRNLDNRGWLPVNGGGSNMEVAL